ncbi:hypothetical protein ScPMuIL_009248 [Solemya velum]
MAISVDRKEPVEGTGLVYDDIFLKHKSSWDPDYPERPERLSAPYTRFLELGLVNRCKPVELTYATEDMILLCHSDEHLQMLKSTVDMTEAELKQMSTKYNCVYFHNMTFESALLAAGSTVELMRQILSKEIRNGLALIRPPGHHAQYNRFRGFCYFNNVAIAAKYALDNLDMKRILIVDWDVHHGQGTQYTFYDDPRVLYISIHRYEYGKFPMKLRESDYDYIGEGAGTGFNVNIPLNQKGMGDSDYLAVFQQIIIPLAYEFDPQVVLVSAGYDAAIGCPEGEMLISPAAFAHFTHMLSGLAEGKLAIVLEGGYHLKSLSEGLALTLKSLLGDTVPPLVQMQTPCDSVTESILNVIKVLQPYWICFQYQTTVCEEESCPFEGVNCMPPRLGIEFDTPDVEKVYPLKYTYPHHEESYQKQVADTESTLDDLIRGLTLTKTLRRTCIVYDRAMRAHKSVGNISGFPERPDRITRVYERLEEWKLLEKCLKVQTRVATQDEIETVHCSAYYEKLEESAEKTPFELQEIARSYNSVFLCSETFYVSRMAAGSTLNILDSVLTGEAENGVSVIRPPGHHAKSTEANGFCFFNNIAITARIAQRKYGSGMGDSEYIAAFQQIIMPIAYQFSPELVLVSAGFDSAMGDPLGNYCLTPAGYGHMTHMLSSLANGKIILVLEGGYNLESLANCMSSCVAVLLGEPVPSYSYTQPKKSAVKTICDVLDVQKKYWECLKFRVSIPQPQTSEDQGSASEDTDESSTIQLQDIGVGKELPSEVTGLAPEELPRENTGLAQGGLSSGVTVLAEQVEQLVVSDMSEDESIKLPVPENRDQNKAPDGSDGATGGSDVAAGSSGGATGGATGGSYPSQSVDVLTQLRLMQNLEHQGVQRMYAVTPLSWCPHLKTVQPLPPGGLDAHAPCKECYDISENWICLVCYEVYCSRFVNEHMLLHSVSNEHMMVLSFSDLSVWCYPCENYVTNEIVQPMINHAHQSKFGEGLPGIHLGH